MDLHDEQLLQYLTDTLAAMLKGVMPESLPAEGFSDPALNSLCRNITALIQSIVEAQSFIAALSEGKLEIYPPHRNHLIAPFKQLHANLLHLTWQTQQIAAGDLNQQVDFLGAFSGAFNSLIASLREKKLAEDKLRYVSNHDALTNLYNRGFFSEEMARLEQSRRFPISILVADVDGLKNINDTLGHSAGDHFIQLAAQELKKGVRSEDILARIGGDEFAVLLPDTDALAADKVVRRIRESRAGFIWKHESWTVNISIGVATAERKGPLSDLLILADKRMYEDKSARKKKAGITCT
ncbi:GGDEF domain-containing protein [Geotalea uraniireducens]|uniref:diguanylate cyclase n=1 Tax=Geotalea uraniireducens (strain Rf4) TaxID=351605 RepID=A5GD09_GEOUR|nr:GGDEF domain-containing protein [Geotalea uraniireducens]ABQ24543.1 diguanylate cyclase [Geotalea uraniireducens Rf4]